MWDLLTRKMQQQIIDKKIEFYAIDAYAIAKATGMGSRINTIMQTCFFAISGVLPRELAIEKIKYAAEKSYSKKGRAVVEANWKAIDETIANLHKVSIPTAATSDFEMPEPVGAHAPDFVKRVTAEIMAGRGDLLPVIGVARRWHLAHRHCDLGQAQSGAGNSGMGRRAVHLLRQVPVRLPAHRHPFQGVPRRTGQGCPAHLQAYPDQGQGIRAGHARQLSGGAGGLHRLRAVRGHLPGGIQDRSGHKALKMRDIVPLREQEKENFEFFLKLPEFDRTKLRTSTIKGAMMMQPLFEFSTACVGCGETPYIRLATQLFGDRMVVANATGCSSIYGGNLPTTPYSKNAEGRGPAWANSLFEDNAEFGLGFRVSIDKHAEHARELLEQMKDKVGAELADAILNADQSTEAGIFAQRERVDQLRKALAGIDSAEARQLESLAEYLVKKSVWIIGGDGWAYDIGFGGLDHVLASGRNVNILVLDTEVYSNTGGQCSKATPRGAMAKFAAGGKPTGKKDLGQIAMSYGHVYVAHVAYGAKDIHTLKTFIEAESFDGPSLIIAYSPCVEHGYDMSKQHQQQELAVNTGHWPLFRYDPRREKEGKNPLSLDSQKPSVPYREFIKNEPRFRGLVKSLDGKNGEALTASYENELQKRYAIYEQMASGGTEAGEKKNPADA